MSALAMNIVDVNITERCVFPRPSRPAPIRREMTGPIEEAWTQGRHALSFSPESQSRVIGTPDWSNASWGEIAKTQPMPKTAERLATLSPYRPVRTDRHELPTEHRLAAEAGITLLDLDGPLAGPTDLTVSDVVVDTAHGWTWDDERGDDFDGPAPFTAPDPREAERILWEQMTTKSGPVTRIRRKHNGHHDFVAVDRSEATRLRGARLGDQIVYVFESPKRYVYPAVRDAYIRRIAKANNGKFPTWDQQVALAKIGQEERAQRERPRVPLADRESFASHLHDALDHAPFQERYADDAITDAMAMRHFGRKVTDLWPEEFDELMSEALRRLGARADMRSHVRNHPNWERAALAMPHIGEYLASDEDIFASA